MLLVGCCCLVCVCVCVCVGVEGGVGGAGKREIGKQTKTDRQADTETINKMLNQRHHNLKQNI